MAAKDQLEQLRDDIKAAGWRIAKKSVYDSIDRCGWYAWLAKRPSGWPDCECNEKPPSLTMTPTVFDMHGSAHGSATFALCGQMGGQWYDLKLYSVALDEAMQTIDQATRSLGAAWQAIAQLEKQT
jgi:hypothetical protein